MDELINLTIAQAKDCFKKRQFSAVELVKAHLARIHAHSHLNAFLKVTEDLALKQAVVSDKKIKEDIAGPIEGIPIGVKDLFCTKGITTTAGSRMLANFVPDYESTVTSLLYKNGGICIGKTNMDEFAMGSSTITSYFGPVISPLVSTTTKQPLVPGGSSGGSAAAVAASLCMGALGSDTGGSIRQPASFCGIVGMKPTYGRCSRWGMIAFASSLDQAGVLTRSVTDAALMLEAICGYDNNDATSKNIPVPQFSRVIGQSIKGIKIGIPYEYRIDGMSPEIMEMWQIAEACLKGAGAEIIHIKLPHTQYALPVYYVIAPAEASANLARYDGIRYGLRISEAGDDFYAMARKTRAAGFGAEVKRRITIGTYVLSADASGQYYNKAQKVRRLICNDFQTAFQQVDAILTPTTPFVAFPIGDNRQDPISMYLNDVFTVPASLAGLPCISVPTILSSKEQLPLGAHIIGKLYDEETALKIAYVLEQELKHKK